MVFLDKGDASQVGSTFSQYANSVSEILALLIQRLQEQREKDAAKPLTPEEQQLTDEACAMSAMEAVKNLGTEHQMASGKLASVYAAEGFTVCTDFYDPAGMPVYTITAPGKGSVLSFQESPKEPGKLVFFETENSLEDEQRISLLKALQSQRNELDTTLQGVDLVKHRLDVLGEMAPAGSKAILVANQLLAETGKDEIKGNTYRFNREKDGAISISHKDAILVPLYRMESDGRISNSNGSVMGNDSRNFEKMYDKLFNQSQQVSASIKPTNLKTTDMVGR
jgi:hypothetical protein